MVENPSVDGSLIIAGIYFHLAQVFVAHDH